MRQNIRKQRQNDIRQDGLITQVQVKNSLRITHLARPLHLGGDVVRGRADRHYGKRNASTLDNNHLIAEYTMIKTLILE